METPVWTKEWLIVQMHCSLMGVSMKGGHLFETSPCTT